MNLSSTRIGGIAGIGFGLVVFGVNLILGAAGQPFAGATPAEVADFYDGAGAAVTIASALAPVAWVLLPLFAAGVVAATRHRSVAQGDAWPLIGLGAAFLQNAIFAGVVACQIVLHQGGLAPDVAWGIWQLHNALFVLNGISLALILGALSIAGLRTGLIRRWHGGLGIVACVGMATLAITAPVSMDGGPFGLLGFAGFLLWVVWIISYGVALLRASREARVGQPTEPVAVHA